MLKLRAFNSVTKRWRWISAPSENVGCVLNASAAVDAHNSVVYFTWDRIYDNANDLNELPALPSGLGLDEAGIGTDTLTTIEAGFWSFTLFGLLIPPDATYEAIVIVGNYGGSISRSYVPVAAATDNRPILLSQTVELPSGVGFSVGLSALTLSTNNPHNIPGPYLSIVRFR